MRRLLFVAALLGLLAPHKPEELSISDVAEELFKKSRLRSYIARRLRFSEFMQKLRRPKGAARCRAPSV